MKLFTATLIFPALLLFSCGGRGENPTQGNDTIVVRDTIVVHDTLAVHNKQCLDGEFIYNLPCKIDYINQDQPGKSILVFWLHGGVKDQGSHDLLSNYNHIDKARDLGYNGIRDYLRNSKTKAIYIAPICHKAVRKDCVRWIECDKEIKRIIDDYTTKGIIDDNRVYVLGASDGGVGTWDLIEKHPEWFAAAMPMSCSSPRKTSVPVYFHSTRAEGDAAAKVNSLNAQGCNIQYQYHGDVQHGGDQIACNEENLKKLFSHVRESERK